MMETVQDLLRGIAALAAYYFIAFLCACVHTYLAEDVGLSLIGLTCVWAILIFLTLCVLGIITCIGKSLK